MTPSHDEAVNAALAAIADAFIEGKPGQHALSDESREARARFILQELRNESTSSGHVDMLEDRIASVSLPAGVVARLLLDSMTMAEVREQMDRATGEADEAYRRLNRAHNLLRKGSGTSNQKYAAALQCLGMLAGEHGKGRNQKNWREIARHYDLLRTGGHQYVNGDLRKVEPHTHDDAVRTIETEHKTEWATLERQWRRHGIKIRRSADVFPRI